MNPEEEKTIPVQATDADLGQTAPNPAADTDTADGTAQAVDAPTASQQTSNESYNAGTDQTNAQYNGVQGYQQNPNAQYGAGMNAGYNTGTNQANAPYNNAQGYQGYQQNPNAQYGAGMNAGYNAGANDAGMNTGYNTGVNQANTPYNNAQGYQGYQQNPNANAQYDSAQSFTQGFQNMTGGAGMNTGYNAGANDAGMNTGYNTGVNQANTPYNNAQGYQGYQQNPNAQYGSAQSFAQGYQQNPNAQYTTPQQGYQNPYYVNPASVPGAMPAKKKSAKKIWIPIVSVVLVAAIAVGVYFLFFKKSRNPEEIVTAAMTNTFSTESKSSVAGWLHSNKLDTLAESGSYQVSMEMNITELSGVYADEIGMLEGLGISSTTALDLDAARYAGSGSILYNGMTYIDYEIYAYDDYIAIACPSLFEGYLEFKTSNFGVDFNNSPLAAALDTTMDPSFAFRFFDLFNTEQQTDTEVPREIQEFLDAIRYEEGDKKDLQVNGKTQTCQGYNIVITREAMEGLVRWFCDYASELGTPISYSDIAEIIPREDLIMHVYVDNKGRMARFSFDFPLDTQVSLSCQIDFTGLNDRPADHVTGNITANVEGYAYGFSFESNTNTSGSTETQNTKMSIDVSGISVANATYTSTFDTASGDAHADLSVSAMYMTILNMNMDFSYTDVVPGERFTLNIDDLSLDIASGELVIGLTGSSTVSKLNGPVSEPSGTKYDLFTITENDIEALAEEIYLNALSGPLGSLIYELYELDDYLVDDWEDWDDDDWNY